jgi:hypothetical protein
MISSFEVGAVFRIINEATRPLQAIRKQIGELNAAVEQARLNLAGLGKVGLSTAVGETQALAVAWREVAASSAAATRSMVAASSAAARASLPPIGGGGGRGGGRHQPTFLARGGGGGGGGAHIGGASVPIPGGGHMRFGGAAAATAGMIGYGAYEAAQMEDAVWQLIYHSGVENNDANKSKFRKIIQDSMRTSGYGLHDVSESAKQAIRMFQGTPGGGIDILPEMLKGATIEARVKGESPEEAMKALIGLSHMTKQYSNEGIKKLIPAFAFLSTANPGSLGSIEKAAGYAVPLLQSGLEIDPMQSLLLGTALTRAGATSTKSGTWLREMAIRAMPGTSMMSKIAFKKHEEALKEMGLVDDQDKPTWFTGGKPDILKMLDIAGANAGKIPIERRAAVERGLFGAQGGGGFALLADPAVREQIQALQKEMNSPEFKNRYGGFMENYNSQVTSQNARTAIQDFNVTMMDIGKTVLPAVNIGLHDLKGILEGIRNILPSGQAGLVAARAAEGAALGAGLGFFAGGVGAGPGAVIGGVAGTAYGYMESQPKTDFAAFAKAMTDNSALHSAMVPPQKPPTINLSLNVDGRALAQAVTDAMGNQTGFVTQAPAADGAGQFFSGDHNYPDN